MDNDEMNEKTPEEIAAENDEFNTYASFGSAPEGEEMRGSAPPAGPIYKNPPTLEPADVPGLDPDDIPEEHRDRMRGEGSEDDPTTTPKVQVEFTEQLEEPNKPETITLPQAEKKKETDTEKKEEQTEEEPPVNNSTETAGAKENELPNTAGAVPETPPNDEQKEPENEEETGPIFCPYCKQELFLETIDGETYYCHHPDEQEDACDESFDSIAEIEEAIRKKEAKKKRLEEARQAEAKRKEEEAKAKEAEAKPQAQTPTVPQSVPSEIYLIFSNQLSGIVKTLAEMQAREEKLDSLSKELTDIKTQLSELKEGKDSLKLPETTAKLEETSKKLAEVQGKIEENLAAATDLKQTIAKLQKGGKDLLAITDNAGEQFYQYMNAVKQLDKYSNRIKFVLPRVEEYLNVLESCYENLTRRYAKDQKEFGEHFKKQTQSFFKEASKKMIFSQNSAGAPGMTSMIIPTIAAFILMFLLHLITK